MTIKDGLCPCEYCRKKDRIIVLEKTSIIFEEPVKFWCIRCTRLLCRIRNALFYQYYDWSCDLKGLEKQWNVRYKTNRKKRRIE